MSGELNHPDGSAFSLRWVSLTAMAATQANAPVALPVDGFLPFVVASIGILAAALVASYATRAPGDPSRSDGRAPV
jgi:hypothetical protein